MSQVVTPLLSSFSFREASLTSSSGENLIAGPADVYLGDQFVGQIRLPPTAVGQKMVVGFELDRQQTITSEQIFQQTENDLRFNKTNSGGGMGGGGVF